MPRRPRPAKPQPVESPSPLHRLARVASDWKAIVGFVLLAFGGIAYALGAKFATKGELAAVQTDVQKHNAELSAIHQALEDIRWDVQQLLPKK